MSKKQKEEKSGTDEVKILFPGDRVELETGVTAIVYPMGFRHIQKFSRDIGGVLMTLTQVGVKKGASEKEVGQAILGHMIPYVMSNLLGLIEETIKFEPEGIELEDIPHWELAPIVEQWVLTNFGEEKKWRPWVAAIENVVNRFSSKPISILEMVSKA